MKLIDFNTIKNLNISINDCLLWVEESFHLKNSADLPAKISQKLEKNIFFNTMPCLINSINRFGVKIVSRFPSETPSLKSEIVLFDSQCGDILAFMDATWITTMRTGAVAALATKTLQKENAKVYSFIGLGNTAIATMLCLLEGNIINKNSTVKLYKYKDQAERFIKRFSDYEFINFEIVEDNQTLIKGSDVIISCVTAADSEMGKLEWYSDGVLVVPVHTRGFQNCDLSFDKVVVDDTAHVSNFKYFNSFKHLEELSDILNSKKLGRENNSERIISYNIGIALHDVYFASNIYNILSKTNLDSKIMCDNLDNIWI